MEKQRRLKKKALRELKLYMHPPPQAGFEKDSLLQGRIKAHLPVSLLFRITKAPNWRERFIISRCILKTVA
jgi:hypothetical protein